MSDDRKTGLALIVAPIGMIITMAVHPHGAIKPPELPALARNLILVHSLAILSGMILFLGALGISRKLRGSDRLEIVAMVLFGFASVAVLFAAILDGFVAPNVFRSVVDAGATPARDMWQVIARYNFEMNQACARVYAVISALSILFWSVCALRRKTFSTAFGIYGCILAIGITILVATGIAMDTHVFGAVVLGQAIWFISAGTSLYSSQADLPMAGSSALM